MHLFFDICQGIGLACAVGIRPFGPALLTGALATGNLGVDFDHTKYAFLESPAFLIVLGVAAVALILLERRGGERPAGDAVFGFAFALGALLFGGSLADHHHASWPGLAGGIVCAAVAFIAVRSLLVRTRSRLDDEAAAALPVYAEALALAVAGLSVLLPPLGLVALAFLLALLVTGRRRGGEKYAGLRVLR
jgi:Domain of unknown function (DUF4126)